MDIVFVKNINSSLSQIFNLYDVCAKKIFETSGVEQQEYIDLYIDSKTKIDSFILKILKEKDVLTFNESDYMEKIEDSVARNLLSNGLYNKEGIDEITKKYQDKIDNFIIEKVNDFYSNYNGEVLIWNINTKE